MHTENEGQDEGREMALGKKQEKGRLGSTSALISKRFRRGMMHSRNPARVALTRTGGP